MLKRIFGGSPLGIALSVAGIVLAVSPEARRATRRLLVKGTASVMGAVDQVRQATADTAETARHAAGRIGEGVEDAVQGTLNAAGRIGEESGDLAKTTMNTAGALGERALDATEDGVENLDRIDLNPMHMMDTDTESTQQQLHH